MTTNTKILLGVGAVALGYYLYKRKIDGKGWNPLSPSKGNSYSTPKGQETIPPTSEPNKMPNAYRLKEDFSQKFPIGTSGSGAVSFKKGQIISAIKNPYLAQNHAVGKGTLTTTPTGGLPNFQMEGQQRINIPERILEKI
jgi:hypothetical protein